MKKPSFIRYPKRCKRIWIATDWDDLPLEGHKIKRVTEFSSIEEKIHKYAERNELEQFGFQSKHFCKCGASYVVRGNCSINDLIGSGYRTTWTRKHRQPKKGDKRRAERREVNNINLEVAISVYKTTDKFNRRFIPQRLVAKIKRAIGEE